MLPVWRRPAAALDAARAGTRPEPAARISTRHRRVLVGIVVLAVAFRALIITSYWPTNHLVMGMTLWDAEMARNLIAGRGWVLNWDFLREIDRVQEARQFTTDLEDFLPADEATATFVPFAQYAHTPGYAVWLATSFVVGGSYRFVYSQYMQALLDASACLLIFGMGRRLWSARAGLIGAVFYALSPAHAYLASQTVAAATDSFWVIAVSYGAVRTWTDLAAGRSGWPGTVIVGLATFAGTAINSTAFLLPAVCAGTALLLAVVSRQQWRVAGYLIVAHAIALTLLLPWALRNLEVYGQFTFLRQTQWQLLWETLGELPNPWGLGMGSNDVIYFDWIRANCPAPCSPTERERVTRAYLMSTVFPSPEFPAHMLRLIRHRVAGLVYVARLPIERPLPGGTPAADLLRSAFAALNFAALFVFPLAAFGLALLLWQRSTAMPALLGLAPTAFVLLFSLLFFIEHRKTTPAFGYLLTLSGVAVAACFPRHATHSR
jgi:hypothetical protein